MFRYVSCFSPLPFISRSRRTPFFPILQRTSRFQCRLESSAVMASPTDAGATERVIVWFRNDLRVHDNYVLEKTLSIRKKNKAEIVPVFVFDPKICGLSKWDIPKMGSVRARFTLEAVLDLKHQLRSLGSDLLIQVGAPETVISKLVMPGKGRRTIVLTQTEVTSEEHRAETRVSAAIRTASPNAKLKKIWGSTLYHLEDLPYDHQNSLKDIPNIFTPFRKKVEANCKPRAPIPTPTKGALGSPPHLDESFDWDFIPTYDQLPLVDSSLQEQCRLPVHENAVLDFKGGESHALNRIKYYLWEKQLITTYFDTRNGMTGGDYSSKLAPWLALGCVSPRYISSEIDRFEKAHVANKSTYWLIFELLWRDFFKFFALKHGNGIFFLNGTGGREGPWRADPGALDAWKNGQTGRPLVDANMRELKATGFMSNRGRQNVASWLALDAGVDWRYGAAWFEHYLIDYDCSSNWGNWVFAAGMTGGRVNRFNIVKQTKDYDPEGEYIKLWCPELRNVPATYIADPSQMPKHVQEAVGCVIGRDYPSPYKLPPRSYEMLNGGRNGDRRHRQPANSKSNRKQSKKNGGGHRKNARMYSTPDRMIVA